MAERALFGGPTKPEANAAVNALKRSTTPRELA
jgi:hypothetical protein